MQCGVEGAPYYSVVIPKSVDCGLTGRDLGLQAVVPNSQSDDRPKSPCLTLTHAVSSLLNIHNGAEIPAALFHDDNNDGSTITLKGTDGGRLAFDFKYFVRLLIRLSRGGVGLHYSCSWNIQ